LAASNSRLSDCRLRGRFVWNLKRVAIFQIGSERFTSWMYRMSPAQYRCALLRDMHQFKVLQRPLRVRSRGAAL
jgi:hypothetical protein